MSAFADPFGQIGETGSRTHIISLHVLQPLALRVLLRFRTLFTWRCQLSSPADNATEAAVNVLLEASDPVRRAHAHLSLAEGALEREDTENAKRHLRQAVDLAPEDDLVRSTTESTRLRAVSPTTKSWWSSWLF